MSESGGGERKQVLVRMSEALWRELASWAKDDFRSINGQIEFLLTECVKRRRRTFEDTAETPDEKVPS